ncbi:MAG: hypothetical protein Cons2KO_13710 [Congregibacter sp.]
MLLVSRQRFALCLATLFVIALVLRVFAALDYGRDWDAPDSFTLINFDEGGSCRAALDGFDYTPFMGWQTVTLASLLGDAPAPALRGDARTAKTYCHSWAHLRVARLYSAVSGALTVVALAALGLLLFPAQPLVALGGAALLALSGWHISESMTGTVDAASTFCITAFLMAAVCLKRCGVTPLRFALFGFLLVAAVWTKYWVFSFVALLAFLPRRFWEALIRGLTPARIAVLLLIYALLFGLVSNPALAAHWQLVLPLGFYVFVPWRRLSRVGFATALLMPWLAPLAMQSELFVAYSSGGLTGRFGTDYGAIGWNKLARNLLNLPLVAMLGLGIPGFCLCLWGGWRLRRADFLDSTWLPLLAVLAFALYMAFLAPVTYYRHYLPLLPVLCLLSAFGITQIRPGARQLVLSVALVWQALLAWDLVGDYHHDPRRALPEWYASHEPRRVLTTYYVNAPAQAGARHRLLRPTSAQRMDAQLQWADTVILSENWYDTAFANELNGPFAADTSRLIKTSVGAAEFYRTALADRHPYLRVIERLSPPRFMPEMNLHYALYGSFTQFVGDIVILEPRG